MKKQQEIGRLHIIKHQLCLNQSCCVFLIAICSFSSPPEELQAFIQQLCDLVLRSQKQSVLSVIVHLTHC